MADMLCFRGAAEFLSRIVPSSKAKEAQQRANDDFYLETLRSSQTVAEARQRRESNELAAARQAKAQEKQAKADARKKRKVSQLPSTQADVRTWHRFQCSLLRSSLIQH